MHFADDPSVCTNTSLAFYRGRLIHRYDKIHLFKPAAEHQYFHRGNSIRAFTVGHGALRLKAGVVICYDLRFPELIRNLALQEMKLLIVPARWPRSRDDAWYALLKARAIENQIFVVGCNAIGKEGGYSYAFDPLGMLVFSNRKKQNRLFNTFTVDIERVRTAKRLHNNLRDAVLLRKASSSLPP
jgi:predicted amidohydrolase